MTEPCLDCYRFLFVKFYHQRRVYPSQFQELIFPEMGGVGWTCDSGKTSSSLLLPFLHWIQQLYYSCPSPHSQLADWPPVISEGKCIYTTKARKRTNDATRLFVTFSVLFVRYIDYVIFPRRRESLAATMKYFNIYWDLWTVMPQIEE